MAHKIVLFNHKGGVSKTTSAFNIGWTLANNNHKTLLVDCDPQCNLTALFLGNSFDQYYTDDSTKNQNIRDGVKMVFDGHPTPIQPIHCPTASRNKNLYLLPGHMNLSEYDAQLNFAQTATIALSSLKSLPGAFNDLIEKTAAQYQIEYIIIDLNPGLSSINQNLFLISDAFLIPTNPDMFSLMAIKSLSAILPKWVIWKTQNIDNFKDSAYPLPSGTPKFIGTIAQRFNIRNGKATSPYKTKIIDLTNLVKSTLIPALEKAGMLFSTEQYKNAEIPDSFCLEEIKDYQGLAPKSQEYNVPVFMLNDKELNASGAALEGMKENREHFKNIYKSIADKISSLFVK